MSHDNEYCHNILTVEQEKPAQEAEINYILPKDEFMDRFDECFNYKPTRWRAFNIRLRYVLEWMKSHLIFQDEDKMEDDAKSCMVGALKNGVLMYKYRVTRSIIKFSGPRGVQWVKGSNQISRGNSIWVTPE